MNPRVLSGVLIAALGAEPPSEFRIFKAGVNEINGKSFLFDAEASAELMARYRAQYPADGRIMIDLNHEALMSPNGRPDSADARGWASLELRNGELWAVNVEWTADGAERIAQKRQRYISPAYLADQKSGRLVELVNIAIVAMPGTHNALPLVAKKTKPGQYGSVEFRSRRYKAKVKSK